MIEEKSMSEQRKIIHDDNNGLGLKDGMKLKKLIKLIIEELS